MVSILDRVLNRAPAPLTSTRRTGINSGINLRGNTANELEVYAAISTLYKVVNLRASSVAQTQWALYQKPPRTRRASELDDERTEVTNHPALNVWDHPNPHTSQTNFLKRWSLHRDLTGEAFIAPDRAKTPTELWQFRPDRMSPRPDPQDFSLGWTYTDPDGKKTAFDHGEVWAFINPSPTDPHRGQGPVQALMTDIDSTRAAADWNRAFFLQGAEIGGTIEVPEGLTDDEFEDMARRLNEQHVGAHNAHRWMVVEHGKVVPNTATHKDMQFEALRNLSRDLIREAFAMPKILLGIGESVNRATANAAWAIYLQQEIVPLLVELRDWLNEQYLPAFGTTARNLEFDFVDPVPMDHEAANAELLVKSQAAATLAAIWEPEQVLETVGLPAMDAKATPDPPPQLEGPPEPPQLEPGEPEDRNRGLVARFRNADDDPPKQLDPSELPDVTPLQSSFERTFDRLFGDWTQIEDDQKAELVGLVRQIMQSGNLRQLEQLAVDTSAAVAVLVVAMREMAEDGAEAIVREAADQDVEVTAAQPEDGMLLEAATIVAGLTAARLIASAKSTAMRHNSGTATPDQIADAVAAGLGELSVEGPRPQLSGALTGSQNDGRLATLRRAPSAAIYASEVNDSETCEPCRQVDGKWLGNSPEDLEQIRALYSGNGFGGYVDCKGRERCRGTVVSVFRPQAVTSG